MKIATCQSYTNLVVFVDLIHTAITLLFSDDFACVLHNDLMRLKAAIATNSISTIRGLDDLDTDAVLATFVSTCCKISKCAVGAVLPTNVAIVLITLVKHYTILAALSAAIIGLANAFRLEVMEVWRFSPVIL